jgi:hypothetical protein
MSVSNTGCMALQPKERSVPPYLNLSLKWILATVSARPGADDETLAARFGAVSAPQEFI